MTVEYRTGNNALTNAEIDSNFKSVAWRYGGNLASAATVTFTDEYNYFHITGTTGISGFTTKAYNDSKFGYMVALEFNDAVTLTYNVAKLVLPGAKDLTTAAGDVAIFVQETATIWRLISYMDGKAPARGGWKWLATFNTAAVTLGENTAIPAGITGLRFVFSGVSCAASSEKLAINLGVSGPSYPTVTSGAVTRVTNAAATGGSSLAGTVPFVTEDTGSSSVIDGVVEVYKQNGADTWIGSGSLSDSVVLATHSTAFTLALGATLDRCKVTWESAANDAGSVQVFYRF